MKSKIPKQCHDTLFILVVGWEIYTDMLGEICQKAKSEEKTTLQNKIKDKPEPKVFKACL